MEYTRTTKKRTLQKIPEDDPAKEGPPSLVGPTYQPLPSMAVHNRPTEKIYTIDLSRFDPTATIHHFGL